MLSVLIGTAAAAVTAKCAVEAYAIARTSGLADKMSGVSKVLKAAAEEVKTKAIASVAEAREALEDVQARAKAEELFEALQHTTAEVQLAVIGKQPKKVQEQYLMLSGITPETEEANSSTTA